MSQQCRCQKGNLRQLCHSGCNIHMEGTDYNKKILQLYVGEWKQHAKGDVKLFKGLLHTNG